MAKAGKPGAALKRSPIHLLHRALQLGMDFYGQQVGGAGVTQRQYAVLCATAAEDGLSQTQLVRITGIDRSTVAELVARMTKLGLLLRQRAAGDARTNVVRLTDRGRALLDEVEPRVAAADRRLLKLLPGKKREDFVRMLQDVVKQGAAVGADEGQDTPAPPLEERPSDPAATAKKPRGAKAKASAITP